MFRLYEGEDFFFEVLKLVPNRLMIGVNLPFAIQGEEGVGVAMLTLTEVDGRTLVSNFMSRHFSWPQEDPNPIRETRESDKFLEFRQSSQNANLLRLKEIVEKK